MEGEGGRGKEGKGVGGKDKGKGGDGRGGEGREGDPEGREGEVERNLPQWPFTVQNCACYTKLQAVPFC